MKKTLLLLIIILFSQLTKADIPEIKFRRLDTRNGMSSSQVNCVLRDSKGFIWMGTAYGLNRYDGYRFKTFYSNNRDTTSVRSNYTDQIMEGYDGKLWLKQGMQYCVYDPETESFERNAGREVEKYLGPHNAVERIHIDKKKNLWVKYYEEGIFFYNTKTKKQTQFKLGYGKNEFKSHYGIAAVAEYKGRLVILTYSGEMVCLNGEKGIIEWENTWVHDHRAKESQNHKLIIDQDDNFWVLAEEYTYCYIRSENRWYSKMTDLLRAWGYNDIPEQLQVWDLKVDRHGWLWIATDHEGLFIVDQKGHQIRQFLNNKFDESTISDNTPRQVYIDNRQTVWIMTYKNGVNQYVEGLSSIKNLELGDINTVQEDNNGNYWIGSNTNGILVYDPKRGEVVTNYTSANSPLTGNIMVGSCKASDGSIWFGSYNGGLIRCVPSKTNPYEATITNWRSSGQPDGLSTNNVWGVTEDKWGRIWITTLGGGIQQLDLRTNKFRTWNSKNTKLPSDYTTCIGWTKKGWLLAGTSWFWCLVNPVTGKLVNRLLPDIDNLPTNIGSSVCVVEDSRELVWQGSMSGVCIWDRTTNRVYTLDMTSGMFGSSVCSITEDKEHMMWVVTEHGVSKIVPTRQDDGTWQFIVRSYNNRDGLQQEVYNQRSTCLTHDGLILIGGQGGLDVINPKALSDSKSKERPIFSGLQLFDVDVPVGKEVDGRVILDEALDVCREVVLRYSDQFTIQLGSDAGRIDNRKRFAYKLEGFNDNWVKTSELNPNITYNSLSAGTYTLCVRMLNDDGTIGDVESQLDITIMPSIWRTPWALVVYAILIAAAALLWRRWYMRRQKQRMEAETLRRETEKMQWMGEMRMRMAESSHAEYHQETTSRQELVHQTTDIVWLLRQLCEDYQHSIGSKAKISFVTTVKTLDADIATNEFTQAIHILLDNSIKFSPGDCRISVGVAQTGEGKVQIQVADNGIGIHDEFKAHAFDHLPGTEGIGLDTVKDIIDAHHGEIRLEDNPGGGTIFFITLPQSEEIHEAIIIES